MPTSLNGHHFSRNNPYKAYKSLMERVNKYDFQQRECLEAGLVGIKICARSTACQSFTWYGNVVAWQSNLAVAKDQRVEVRWVAVKQLHAVSGICLGKHYCANLSPSRAHFYSRSCSPFPPFLLNLLHTCSTFLPPVPCVVGTLMSSSFCSPPQTAVVREGQVFTRARALVCRQPVWPVHSESQDHEQGQQAHGGQGQLQRDDTRACG